MRLSKDEQADENAEWQIDFHPVFRKTGCSSGEALQSQRQACPVLIKYAPPLGEGNAHECPHCGGKIYPEYKAEKCELCGMPYSTVRQSAEA